MTSEVLTGDHTTNTHKRIRGVGFRKGDLRPPREIRKFARKEMGTPDVCTDTPGLNKAVWAKGIRSVPLGIGVWWSRICNGGEDLPNKLRTLVTYVPASTFKNLPIVHVDDN